jgi:hypothetical protein
MKQYFPITLSVLYWMIDLRYVAGQVNFFLNINFFLNVANCFFLAEKKNHVRVYFDVT